MGKPVASYTAALWLGAVALAGVQMGCVTEGHDFQPELGWIKENVTKQDDVRMVMGEPYSVGNAGGTPTWTYGYYKYSLFGNRHTKELKFHWNPNKTVRNYSFSSNFPDETGKAKGGHGDKAASPPSGPL